jgi:hypothetical protein
MAEMELIRSRPFEPELDYTSGGKWRERFVSF